MDKDKFFSEISQWAKDSSTSVVEEMARTTRVIFTMVIDRSPRDTGRFINNWIVSPTDVSYSVIGTSDWDKKIAEMKSIITDDYFTKYNQAYIVNNLFYSDMVEHGWPGGRMGYAPVTETIEKLNRLAKVGNGFAPVGQTLGAIMGGV